MLVQKSKNASSDEYASFTQVKIMYTISSNLIDERSYYSLKFDSITDEKTSNYEICQNIKHLKETYEIEEDEIQYINIKIIIHFINTIIYIISASSILCVYVLNFIYKRISKKTQQKCRQHRTHHTLCH